MKPLNNTERKKYRLKFIGMYVITIVLIIVVLSAFLQPATAIKIITVEKEKPAVVKQPANIIKQNATQNNFQERDSLIAAISFNKKKIDSLNAFIQEQNDSIAILQNQSSKADKPVANTANKSEITKLNKQIQFYDWALRSQISVTNTLTKENTVLKNKVAELTNANNK